MNQQLAEAARRAASALRALADDLRECAYPSAARAAEEAAVRVEAVEACSGEALDRASDALDAGVVALDAILREGGSPGWRAWLQARIEAAEAASSAAISDATASRE